MCRFVAYAGAPVFLDSLRVAPPASLIAQSLAAREAKTIVNADGCGIGWYGERDEPGVYHGILPAWSDPNLTSICHQLRSRMFVAHVRSATSGEVAAANCHPFAHAPHLFMHNGQIGGVRRGARVAGGPTRLGHHDRARRPGAHRRVRPGLPRAAFRRIAPPQPTGLPEPCAHPAARPTRCATSPSSPVSPATPRAPA